MPESPLNPIDQELEKLAHLLYAYRKYPFKRVPEVQKPFSEILGKLRKSYFLVGRLATDDMLLIEAAFDNLIDWIRILVRTRTTFRGGWWMLRAKLKGLPASALLFIEMREEIKSLSKRSAGPPDPVLKPLKFDSKKAEEFLFSTAWTRADCCHNPRSKRGKKKREELSICSLGCDICLLSKELGFDDTIGGRILGVPARTFSLNNSNCRAERAESKVDKNRFQSA